MKAGWDDVATAIHISTYSFKALAEAFLPMLRAAGGASLVGLDFDATVAWPIYDWMGVAKAGLESLSRYLARDLGPDGIRVNLVAAGPVRTMAAKSIPGFSTFEDTWADRAPLGWDVYDIDVVAKATVALLSDWFPMTPANSSTSTAVPTPWLMTGPRLRFVDPTGLYEGVPYHYAAAVGPHELLFTAGACPSTTRARRWRGQCQRPGRPSGHQPVRHPGGGWVIASLVLHTTLYVASSRRGDLVSAWDVLHDRFGEKAPPSTLLGVACLGYPEQLVEIQAVALIAPPD